jgi:hypothetical protein
MVESCPQIIHGHTSCADKLQSGPSHIFHRPHDSPVPDDGCFGQSSLVASGAAVVEDRGA